MNGSLDLSCRNAETLEKTLTCRKSLVTSMSQQQQHGDGASLEGRVEPMSARGVSAIAYSGNGSGVSDGWDSDGSEDSVFSIDDHHLPWEVTEKLHT